MQLYFCRFSVLSLSVSRCTRGSFPHALAAPLPCLLLSFSRTSSQPSRNTSFMLPPWTVPTTTFFFSVDLFARLFSFSLFSATDLGCKLSHEQHALTSYFSTFILLCLYSHSAPNRSLQSPHINRSLVKYLFFPESIMSFLNV